MHPPRGHESTDSGDAYASWLGKMAHRVTFDPVVASSELVIKYKVSLSAGYAYNSEQPSMWQLVPSKCNQCMCMRLNDGSSTFYVGMLWKQNGCPIYCNINKF